MKGAIKFVCCLKHIWLVVSFEWRKFTTHPTLSFRLAIENIAWRRLQQNVISLQRRTIIKSQAETLIACFHTSQLVLLMSSRLSFEIRSLKSENESTFNVFIAKLTKVIVALQALNTSLLLANTSQDLISAKMSPHCTNHLHGPHIKCIITLLKQERSVVEFPAGKFANVVWKI